MNRDIEEIEFTIFDTETTGLDPRCGDRIVEIAAIRVTAVQKTRIIMGRSIAEGRVQT